MAGTSTKTLEVKKDDINEAMPTFLANSIPSGVQNIIYEYYFCANPKWLKESAAVHTFFGIPFSQKKILALAEHAGPFNTIESYIREAYNRRESHLSTTLIQAIKQAITGLDVTIRNEQGAEIEKGMAETLLELHKELFPDSYLEALKQARLAAPDENQETIAMRVANLKAVERVFNAILLNNENTAAEIERFKKFVKNTKPSVITDNRYYLNLIHLVFAAFDVLAKRGGNLPFIKGEEYRRWYGSLAYRFCSEIIGDAIEKELPPRMRQILRTGLSLVFDQLSETYRYVDIDGCNFFGACIQGKPLKLGVNFYYGEMGLVDPGNYSICQREGGPIFLKLITSNNLSVKKLLDNNHSSHRCLVM